MSGPTQGGTAEPVSRDQILRRERGQEKIYIQLTKTRQSLLKVKWVGEDVRVLAKLLQHNKGYRNEEDVCHHSH